MNRGHLLHIADVKNIEPLVDSQSASNNKLLDKQLPVLIANDHKYPRRRGPDHLLIPQISTPFRSSFGSIRQGIWIIVYDVAGDGGLESARKRSML